MKLPDTETIHRMYDAVDECVSDPAARDQKNYRFWGMTFTSELGTSSLFGLALFGWLRRERYVTIPSSPSRWQKVLAFVSVKMKIVGFARREKDWSDYAFSCNARKIFKW